MPLSEVRKKIDDIDSELIKLLEDRFKLSKEVADIKRNENIPVLNNSRENDILDKIDLVAENYAPFVKAVYATLFDTSRSLQHVLLSGESEFADYFDTLSKNKQCFDPTGKKIACFGVEGSYSNIAARKLFKENEFVFAETFEKVFELVKNNTVSCGVVPIENSTAGSINENYDLLRKYGLKIIMAGDLPIHHCLLAKKGTSVSDIKTVYSHPQAISQCQDFIEKNGFKAIPQDSTSACAEMVSSSEDYSFAAIASEEAAEEYGLEIISRNIQSNNKNTTRFVAVTKEVFISDDADKISIMFTLPHRTGSLYKTLMKFAFNGLNLTKIESRPISGQDFEYYFYLDFKGNISNENTRSVLNEIGSEANDFTFLGNYKECSFN